MDVDKYKGEPLVETTRTRKRSRWNVSADLEAQGCKGPEAPNNVTEVTVPLDLVEGRSKRGISKSSNNLISEKVNKFLMMSCIK